MKAFLLITGIVLVLLGALVSLGTIIGIIEETSEYSLSSDIIGMIFFGLGPVVGGLFLCKKALEK